MKRVYSIFCILSALLILIIVLLPFYLGPNVKGPVFYGNTDLTKGWTDENGNPAVMYGKDFPTGDGTMKRTVTSDEINGGAICCKCSYVEFSMYLGDTKVYDYHVKKVPIYGKYYGTAVVAAPLPDFTGEKILKIKYHTLLKNSVTGFNRLSAQPSGKFKTDLIKNNLVRFSLSAIPFIYGIVLIIIGTLNGKSRGMELSIVSLGLISMLVSAWSGSHTMVITTITGNSSFMRASEFISLMLLPAPFLLFISFILENKNNIPIFIAVLIVFINTVVQITLTCLGISDYFEMLKVDHLIILGGIVLIIIILIRSAKEQITQFSGYKLILAAITVLFISGILDIVNFYIRIIKDFSIFTSIGIIVFECFLSVALFQKLIKMRLESEESQKMAYMAKHDALTDLWNRAEFIEVENSIKKLTKEKFIFVQFDINYLKKVNDTYGHSQGDKRIIGAAKAIKSGFGKYGEIFRVGGDEFFAILKIKNEDHDKMFDKCRKRFQACQDEYNQKENPPIPLSISYGYEIFDPSTDPEPENAERSADAKMYAMKKKMKAVRTD